MKSSKLTILFALLTAALSQASAAVKLTAIQVISTDANGKIQGVGAHRFKTTLHGGQPAIFVVKGSDLAGAIINGPGLAQNDVSIPMTGGVYTYSLFTEVTNSYKWNFYTLNLHFDNSNVPQISALTAINSSSTQFFPPISANSEFTDAINSASVKAPNTLVYKSGQTTIEVTDFHFSAPNVYNQDRVSAIDTKSDKVLDYIGEITFKVTAPPEISLGGVVNAASFGQKVAPGSLFSIFGSDLATTTDSAAALPLPNSIAGTSVTIGGKPAPLFFVSPGQVNAQVPYELAEGTTAPVIVTVNGVASLVANVSIVPAAPGIFQFGDKRAVVQNADNSVNNVNNAAASGSYVVAYLTGAGNLDNPVATGAVAGSSPLSRPRQTVTATVNNLNAEIAFAGLTPGFIGLMQVNLKLPVLPAGNYPLVVTMNGQTSNAAMITIK